MLTLACAIRLVSPDYVEDQHDQPLVLDGVQNPPVADPNAVQVVVTLSDQLLGTGRPGFLSQVLDRLIDPLKKLAVPSQCAKGTLGPSANFDSVPLRSRRFRQLSSNSSARRSS